MTSVQVRDFSLRDRYELDRGEVYLSGLQAIVRIPLDQHRIDVAAGLKTGTLISGYEGSPLGGLDLELQRRSALLDAAGVVFKPAVNEELGANAVQGSQLASASQDKTVDGVVGIWYGKAPGLDRSTDAMRHGNLGGADPHGGVLALVGDDSIAKSSTVPSSSEVAMAEIGMTVLSPSDPQDVLDLGLHGIALSRFCGLWTGLKLATNVVDGYASVRVLEQQITPVIPSRDIDGVEYRHEVSANFLQPHLGRLEQNATNERLELALRYARANGLNRRSGDVHARVGVIAAGATYLDVCQALTRLGIDPSDLDGSGLRLLKLGMVSPIDHEEIRQFAEALDEIVVVEEKRPFIELAVKDALYGLDAAPAVSGRRDPSGNRLFRPTADLPPELIADALADRLATWLDVPGVASWRATRQGRVEPRRRIQLAVVSRTPYFCSGCPHNRSTVVPEGTLVGAGIGCSGLVGQVPGDDRGEVIGFTQMGGEGASWIGMSPFVSRDHLVQNLGDGTFHHSGSLALRGAVAAGSHMTYKILYNDAVAMTGGQEAVGKMSVVEVTRAILNEGVAKVVITTDDPRKYRRIRLPKGVQVRHRDELVAVQEELAKIQGVTALIHDQECATELRRKRKRGLTKEPDLRAVINERVCEGCGDCGVKSNCLSVQPIETPFGRKTQIHQASCNKDYSCLDGDCPSFISVKPGRQAAPARTVFAPIAADAVSTPTWKVDVNDFNLRITGVGGTGVVTTAQVIATAATISGLYVRGLDQMGMAQKGGAVVSDLRVAQIPFMGANKVGQGTCDLYLGCDLLVAADEGNLSVLDPERSIAVTSTTKVPTGAMVADTEVEFPDVEQTLALIHRRVRRSDSMALDARELTLALFGDDQFANIFLVGVAVQAGALPIDPAFVEQAIELNGVKIDTNLQAFRWGRRYVEEPESVEGVGQHSPEPAEPLRADVSDRVDLTDASPEFIDAVSRGAGELVAYQSQAYADLYVERVERVRREVRARIDSDEIAAAYAIYLYKLMAYKDEYEVARLSLDPTVKQRIESEFGVGAKQYFRLHPPILRALGMKKKISLGPWFAGVFRLLYVMRRVRGTRWDVFGIGKVRRLERALPQEYTSAMLEAVQQLDGRTEPLIKQVAELPDRIRGYESIKLTNVAKYRSELAAIQANLDRTWSA